MIRDNDFVIDDSNAHEHLAETVTVDGKPMRKGLVPRDYTQVPVGFYSAVPALADVKCPPRNDWAKLIQEGEADQSFLSHIRRKNGPEGGHIPALDQNSQGFCWAYSAHACVMLWRAKMGLSPVRLSAHGVACIIKGFKDEGGWAALSADYIAKNGCFDVEHWPEKSMSRSNDNAAARASMAAYKVDGEWRDLAASVYDANFSEEQSYGLLFARIPQQNDFNWWSHSVCIMDPTLNVRPTESKKLKQIMATDYGSLDLNNPKDMAVYADAFGKRGLNSWTDNYGDLGEFVLGGTKARCDGGVAVGVPVAA
jgi:hypothetical protein